MPLLIQAQAYHYTGKVIDGSGSPLSGVVVKLLSANMADTTGADGTYRIVSDAQPIRGRHAPQAVQLQSLRVQGGRLFMQSLKPVTASIKLYTVRGELCRGPIKCHLPVGESALDIGLKQLGQTVYLLHLDTDDASQVFKLCLSQKGLSIQRHREISLQSAARAALQATTIDWLQAAKSGYASHVQPLTVTRGVFDIRLGAAAAPVFGNTVMIFDPSMQMSSIQTQVNQVFSQQERAQFGSGRHAFLFKPGTYSLDVNVGFYTEVLGLGLSPDSVVIRGAVHSEADWMSGNATCTFWRSVAGLCVEPTTTAPINWAVSQAAPFRRNHIKGDLKLTDGGWASGGFIADSKIDGVLNPDVQQQWITRNTEMGSWANHRGSWNFVFLGVTNTPTNGVWPAQPYTIINKTPLIREKPFLHIDDNDNYFVRVPHLQTDSTRGVSWASGYVPGESIPLDQFHIARAGSDNASTINAALAQGKNLLVTPGIYRLDETIRITRPGTVVLGIGLPLFVANNGIIAVSIADVDGVKFGGIMIDAGLQNSPNLLVVGEPGSANRHAHDPICLYDIFCRAGGMANGLASCFVTINSHDVLGDHFWLWRADHGAGAGWNSNRNANCLIVNGDNVTVYGLFAEHSQEYQTIWNGNGGRTYLYQSEFPYDPPNQAAWQHDGINGWASYKVSNHVTSHEAWGLGCYLVLNNASVNCYTAIEAPEHPDVRLTHMLTLWLRGGSISHVINERGNGLSSYGAQRVTSFP